MHTGTSAKLCLAVAANTPVGFGIATFQESRWHCACRAVSRPWSPRCRGSVSNGALRAQTARRAVLRAAAAARCYRTLPRICGTAMPNTSCLQHMQQRPCWLYLLLSSPNQLGHTVTGAHIHVALHASSYWRHPWDSSLQQVHCDHSGSHSSATTRSYCLPSFSWRRGVAPHGGKRNGRQ